MAKSNHKRAGTQQPGFIPRQASTAEIAEGAERLMKRLGRHLDALENGEVGAVDDVASVLRTLLARGTGDDVIKRLCNQSNIPMPHVYVSAAAPDEPNIALAIGGIPMLMEEGDIDNPPLGDWVPVEEWTQIRALIVDGGKPRRVNTWSEVITLYANTFGSHLSGTVPHLLDATSVVQSTNQLDIGEYMVHCAGIVAEDALGQALRAIGGAASDFWGLKRRRLNPMVGFALLREPEGHGIQVSTAPRHLRRGERIDLVMVFFNNHYLRVECERDQGEGDAFIDFTIHHGDVPEWWQKPPVIDG